MNTVQILTMDCNWGPVLHDLMKFHHFNKSLHDEMAVVREKF